MSSTLGPCKYPPCENDARTAGYCWAHYGQLCRGEELRPARGTEAFYQAMLNEHGEKQCSRCEYWLPLEEFNARRDSGKLAEKYGRSHCKRCNILRRMSITARDYDALLEKQGGGCAICGRTENSTPGREFAVDHDHACCPSGKSCGKCIRGILCDDCNVLLGRAHDDANTLLNAISYLAVK